MRAPDQLPDPAPIACSLGAGELAGQAGRWRRLVRSAGTGRAAAADGIALRFRADAEVERELRALATAENECCSWARWEVRPAGDGELVMQAHATGDGVGTLQAMFLPGA